MLKVFGAALVVIACTLAGRAVARAFAERPRQLRALQGALQELETEIIYGAVPLEEALEHIAVREDRLIGRFFTLVLKQWRGSPGCTASEAWSEALAGWHRGTNLTADDLAALKLLGCSLGASDRQDQQKHLVLAREKLAHEETEAWKVAGRTVKPWNYLGFLGGLVVVLIFI